VKTPQEKQMEFILENLADVAARQARSERQIHALQAIVKTGMKMLVGLTAAQKKTDAAVRELAVSHKELAVSHKELADSHKKTEEALRELAASQKRWFDRNPNGKA